MPHVSGTDLTARDALSPDTAASLALTMVEAAICPGVPDVLTRAEREVILSKRRAVTPYPQLARISCLELGAWPITGVVSVTGDGDDLTANVQVSRFALYLPAYSFRDTMTVRFITGYADNELPPAIKTAVVRLGSKLLQGELDVSRISWGEGVSETYVGATDELLPPDVLELIAPYRFVGF